MAIKIEAIKGHIPDVRDNHRAEQSTAPGSRLHTPMQSGAAAPIGENGSTNTRITQITDELAGMNVQSTPNATSPQEDPFVVLKNRREEAKRNLKTATAEVDTQLAKWESKYAGPGILRPMRRMGFRKSVRREVGFADANRAFQELDKEYQAAVAQREKDKVESRKSKKAQQARDDQQRREDAAAQRAQATGTNGSSNGRYNPANSSRTNEASNNNNGRSKRREKQEKAAKQQGNNNGRAGSGSGNRVGTPKRIERVTVDEVLIEQGKARLVQDTQDLDRKEQAGNGMSAGINGHANGQEAGNSAIPEERAPKKERVSYRQRALNDLVSLDQEQLKGVDIEAFRSGDIRTILQAYKGYRGFNSLLRRLGVPVVDRSMYENGEVTLKDYPNLKAVQVALEDILRADTAHILNDTESYLSPDAVDRLYATILYPYEEIVKPPLVPKTIGGVTPPHMLRIMQTPTGHAKIVEGITIVPQFFQLDEVRVARSRRNFEELTQRCADIFAADASFSVIFPAHRARVRGGELTQGKEEAMPVCQDRSLNEETIKFLAEAVLLEVEPGTGKCIRLKYLDDRRGAASDDAVSMSQLPIMSRQRRRSFR